MAQEIDHDYEHEVNTGILKESLRKNIRALSGKTFISLGPKGERKEKEQSVFLGFPLWVIRICFGFPACPGQVLGNTPGACRT
ncbi:MAG: hypothetical protein V1736_12910 [Pseudomonadota bacterium]